MTAIRRIQIGEAELLKKLRLASLREAPYAFLSTYEAAVERSDQSWREQADGTAQGSDRATFIAFSDDAAIGIAALYRLPNQPNMGEMLQVWVAPEYRAKGVAQDLVDAVLAWAGKNNFKEILATVANGNDRALRFYRKYGFVLTNPTSLNNANDVTLIREVAPDQPC